MKSVNNNSYYTKSSNIVKKMVQFWSNYYPINNERNITIFHNLFIIFIIIDFLYWFETTV